MGAKNGDTVYDLPSFGLGEVRERLRKRGVDSTTLSATTVCRLKLKYTTDLNYSQNVASLEQYEIIVLEVQLSSFFKNQQRNKSKSTAKNFGC